MNVDFVAMDTGCALPINTAYSEVAELYLPNLERYTRGATAIAEVVDNNVLRAFRIDRERPRVLFLDKKYLDYLEPNWDGEGAKPITNRTLANADRFMAQLAEGALLPELTPEADGYIEFEWYVDPDNVFSISFGPSNIVSYSGVFGGVSRAYGAEEFSNGIPETIWAYIRRITDVSRPAAAAAA